MKIILTLQASTLRTIALGTSLVVQGLRLLLSRQGVRVQALVRKLRSHMPHGQKTKTVFVSIHSFILEKAFVHRKIEQIIQNTYVLLRKHPSKLMC